MEELFHFLLFPLFLLHLYVPPSFHSHCFPSHFLFFLPQFLPPSFLALLHVKTYLSPCLFIPLSILSLTSFLPVSHILWLACFPYCEKIELWDHLAFCVHVPLIVASQLFGKHVPAATNARCVFSAVGFVLCAQYAVKGKYTVSSVCLNRESEIKKLVVAPLPELWESTCKLRSWVQQDSELRTILLAKTSSDLPDRPVSSSQNLFLIHPISIPFSVS